MRLFVVFGLVFFLLGCSNVRKEDLGLARVSPNEKVVEQRDPLIIPSYVFEQ